MRIVASSGSLRSGSSNLALLRVAARVAPPGMEIRIFEGLGGLPHFNPDLDLDGAHPPPSVREFRDLLAAADASQPGDAGGRDSRRNVTMPRSSSETNRLVGLSPWPRRDIL